VFTSSGTEANNIILHNYKDAHIFVSAIEHVAILGTLKRLNIEHSIIKVDQNGILDIEDLQHKLSQVTSKRKLVSVIYANNETGVVQDIKQICSIAKEYGADTHSDCMQAYGKTDMNMHEDGIDFVTIGSHKIGGPVGAACLVYKKHKTTLEGIIYGGGQEMGLRAGTENIVPIYGLSLIAKSIQDIIIEYKSLMVLRDKIEDTLHNYKNFAIASKGAKRLPNTSMIFMKGVKNQIQLIEFDKRNIAVSSGSACSSGKVGPSYVLQAMNYSDEDALYGIRVSLGFDTTPYEVELFIKAWSEINRPIGQV
jgi:cysteine desulfurase